MNHDAICAHLPHAGRMCLLEHLESWDNTSITCIATSHRDVENPLRHDGRLHAVAGVEYAAQVMALHGYLLSAADAPPSIGYLASVRDLKLDVDDLGAVSEDLRVTAHRLSGDSSGLIYEFEIRAGARIALSGRLTAKLMAAGKFA
jgi:predicted hotdog family 3-hydroxylacyl-ACP dehydratase